MGYVMTEKDCLILILKSQYIDFVSVCVLMLAFDSCSFAY